MVAKDFEVDDLVWAKMKGFPPWPAKIAEPKDPKSPSAKKAQHFVYFFGTHDNAWILDENITPHSEEMLKNSESYKKKTAAMLKAIEEIQDESKAQPPKKQPAAEQPPKTPKRPAKSMPASKKSAKKRKMSSDAVFDALQETPSSDAGFDEDPPDDAKSKGSEDAQSDTEEAEPKTKKAAPKKTPRKTPAKKTVEVEPEPEVAVASSDEDLDYDAYDARASRIAIIPPFHEDSSRDTQQKTILNRVTYPRPPTPSLDILTPSARLVEKGIEPTTKKIGFLGLGMIGRGMVKNLLNSGHLVTIWNRSRERCSDFVRAGADIGETPSDVVAACDIILCCVSDPATAKALVFGNCGVLTGLSEAAPGKGFVEMTSIDPSTSQEIAEAISEKGGRYLEAPVIGSRQLAEDGQLVLLAAGDKNLFHDCESCFQATSKNSYYVSCDVGAAAKMNLIQSMLTGSVAASLAEAMALLDTCRLNPKDFLEVLELGPLGSPYLLEKCKSMVSNEYAPNTPLKHQQKDMVLALGLGNLHHQPLCMAAAANEIFKRARLLRYSEHDVAAVQIGAKV